MAGGLFALLDDVAALARLAAASVDDVGAAAGRATGKAAGLVIDDTAVTPQYVRGVAADRELPIIKKIAAGSLKNKLVFILPAALLLSQFAPWLLTPILMIGGAYLCFEAGEKIFEAVQHRRARRDGATAPAEEAAGAQKGPVDEKTVVANAVRTDLILSAEIMVIALDSVASEGFLARLVILLIVALVVTAGVYGIVGLIVKADDVGLRLAESGSGGVARLGRGIVNAMPGAMTAISVIGTAAMLWVGGHIELIGLRDIGLTAPYDLVHHLEEGARSALEGAGALAGVGAWATETFASAVFGAIVATPLVVVAQWWHGRQGSH